MTSWSRLQWLLCLGEGGAVVYDHPSVGLMKVLSEGTGNRRPETQCQQGQLTFGGMKTKVQYRGKDTGGLTPEHFALQGASPELGGKALRGRTGLPSAHLLEQLLYLLPPLLTAPEPAPHRGGAGTTMLGKLPTGEVPPMF